MLRIDSSDPLENGPFAEGIESEDWGSVLWVPYNSRDLSREDHTDNPFDLLVSFMC